MVKVGDRVEDGQPLFVVHAREESTLSYARSRLSGATKIFDKACEPLPLFYGLVNSD
jgi:pyrimidine-nucleoside phosphorylase